ncbi:hypothetical protein L7F22_054065 [Adiantum nelumboides]|nr:hypothetical protein [Adiantum nelumboides]
MSKNDGISGFVNDKLDKNNFHAWKFRMTNFLMGKGYWDYIDGNQEEMSDLPDVNPTAEQIKAFKDWNQGVRKVMYWLLVSVQDTMIRHIQDATSPKQAWDTLVSVDTTNTKARKIQLKNELNTIKKREPSEHPSASRITIRLTLELAGKPYDLSTSFNANRFIIRLVDGCSKDSRCVFSALNCGKLQRGPFEHSSPSRITIRLALDLAAHIGKPYYIRFALKLVGKPYDLSASFNAKRITKRLADGCSEDPRCVFSALDCVKLQHGSFEHPSASRISIRFALELAGKPYNLPASSKVSRLTIRLADGCSKDSHCIFGALDCVKLQRGSFEHPSVSRITIRLALKLAVKSYDLPASSTASRLTIQFADECSKGSRCVFSALNSVKLQRGPFEHPSTSRITIRLISKLVGKPDDLPASSNASRLTIRLADGWSKDSRCVFSALECVKLQRGPSEHPSTSRITIRLALELVGKPYDLSASFNANRLLIRLTDGCSKDSRCVFSTLNCGKLQRGPFEHSSANRITIRLALDLAGKAYDLPASSNASRITKQLADVCSKARVAFSMLQTT